VNFDDIDEFLYVHFGTHCPYWLLTTDSNALRLSSGVRTANVAIALTPQQAAEIRTLSAAPSRLALTVTMSGQSLKIHLLGRKIDHVEWRGVASARSNFAPPESIIAEAEQKFVDNVIKISRKTRD
jgi:c-di-GMP phosphodiesterase Gmr